MQRSTVVAGECDSIDPDDMIVMRNVKMADPAVIVGSINFSLQPQYAYNEDDTPYCLTMSWKEYETDAEFAARIERERIYEKDREMQERAEYERLAKKFGNK